MNTSTKILGLLVGVAGTFAAPTLVRAQDYPNRSITVVVPFPAGGPSDVIARIVTEHMAKTLGQTIVIENVGAAGGTVGSAPRRRGSAGRLHAVGGQHGIACGGARADTEHQIRLAELRADRSHRPFARGHRRAEGFSGQGPGEFVAYLKKHGSAVKQAHGGIGASSHMACLLFTSATKVNPTLVAYRGSVLGMNDMIGGHVDFLCEQSVSVSKQVSGGTIKAYGISATQRLAALP